MPSSDGQFVDMPPGADPVRQREPDPIVAKLQERMERLPHGHPSSPYNDDGSRKPPLPDLSQYELPVPGDPDYRPEPSRASEADRQETQTSEHVRPGANADERPESTADRTELWEVPPDVEPPTDTEDAEYVPAIREQLDQAPALDLAPDEEDTPDARGEASQEEGEASHDALADDLDERAADELPISGDLDHQPEPSRASEAEGPTDEGSASASDRQHTDDKAAADEQPAPDSKAARPSDSGDRPRSGADGSWEWKGRSLTPEESQSSDRGLARWASAEGRDADGNYGEHGLTPARRRIEAQLEHGELVPNTEKYALKTADRFKEKVARERERNPDKSTEELISEIHDAVRYTFILKVDEYHEAYWAAEDGLKGEGYELEVRRNMWANVEYKGMNSRWRDPDSGLPFEIQFHTQASWEAKQQTHAAYEKIEDTRTPAVERERLRAHQKEISAKIHKPPRVMEIPDYRKRV